MKQMLFAISLVCVLWGGTVEALDKNGYVRLAEESIAALKAGPFDADGRFKPDALKHLIAKQEQMLSIGVEAIKAAAIKAPAQEAKAFQILLREAPRMSKMSLTELQTRWYEGKALTENGVVLAGHHFDNANNLMDLVIHPAAVIINLNLFQQTRDKKLLLHAKYELTEVLAHAGELP